MRVYLPCTFVALRALVADGSVTVDRATAVTADLRASLPQADDEELELEALLDAAELSLALVRADTEAPRRRVVLAADVPDALVETAPEVGASAVRLTAAVARSALASVHVDEAAAEAQVGAGDVDGVDLLWYAVQELEHLLAG